MERLNKTEWLDYIAEASIHTLQQLQDKDTQLTEEEWALADLCGGYIHIYNLVKKHRLIDKNILPESDTIH
jgi:hypothetical protein